MTDYRVLSWSRVGKHQNFPLEPEYRRAQQLLAVRAFDLLTGRDVFFDRSTGEDALQCLQSAMSIRGFFEQAGYNAYGGPLYDSFRRLREASRSFVRAAGSDAQFYQNDMRFFFAMLQTYRETVGSRTGLDCPQLRTHGRRPDRRHSAAAGPCALSRCCSRGRRHGRRATAAALGLSRSVPA